jgi:predicted N-acetyltransferase YhbS
MNIKIRKEVPDDYDTITLINNLAFKQKQEGNLIAQFDAPDEAMMAIELEAGSLDPFGGLIEFPKEYYDAL